MKGSDMFRRARLAWPALALTAFWLPVLGPLVQSGLMTCSHDGMLHLLRAFQLDALARQGVWWPRWSPGMALGYGYPLFNFYPALSLYPALILQLLGLGLLQSWNLSMALSVLASGLAMYLWAQRVLGQRAGFVAAVAYMLAPYQLYDVYWRGSTAEALALPLVPFILWAALRMTQERRWRYALVGTLAYAALWLTHVLTGLMFTPVLLFYLVWLLWGARERRPVLFQMAGMVILGLGLAAFFLVPAYLERDQVQLWRGITPGGLNYGNHFLTLGELLGPAQAGDPLLVNPSLPRSLGWAAGMLAVVGVLATVWRRAGVGDTHRRHVAWAAITLLLVILVMLPPSEPVWSRVPLLPFVQFPWRFLGVGSLLAALLAGAGVAVLENTLPHTGVSTAVAGLCAVTLAASAAPWTYPRLCPAPSPIDQALYVKYEKSTGTLGTTASGEYLPVAVQEVPANSPFVKPMRAGQPVIRWDAPGAHVLQARDDGLSAELALESDTPVQVTYDAFYFPGWRARLDGQPVSLAITPPFGLMAVNVPAGHHTLTIQFGSTPLRTISVIVSLIAALVLVTIGAFDLYSMRPSPISDLRPPVSTFHPPGSFTWLGLTVLGLGLLSFKVGVVDRLDTPLRWRRLLGGQFKGASHLSDVMVAGSARLLGYDSRLERVAAGDVLYVDLYWTLDKPLNLRAAVRLLDKNGLEWSDKSELDTALGSYAGLPPSGEWPPGWYADDRHAIRVLPGTPPGDYALVVVPFDPETLEPLPVGGGQSAPGGYPGAVVGKVQVTAPSGPSSAEALDLAVRAGVPLGVDLTLVGYSQDRQEATPGQAMLLTLGWQARRKPQADYAQRLELVAPDGQPAAQWSLPPGGDSFPTSRWAAGEVVRSQISAHIPGRATSGDYLWRITLLDGGGAPVGSADLGRLQITAPQRLFNTPVIQYRVDARLGDWVVLAGFDAPDQVKPGQSMQVTLVWQALGETDQDYKVFVHLLGPDGRLVAQSDAMPASWTRPTSGWQVGEFVTDPHTLDLKPDLPPGEYRLVAGMYDATTGQRLPVAAGGDRIELIQVLVR